MESGLNKSLAEELYLVEDDRKRVEQACDWLYENLGRNESSLLEHSDWLLGREEYDDIVHGLFAKYCLVLVESKEII